MRTKFRIPRPTTAIACVALFCALAGGSAVALQGRNTVDSGDLKRGAVKTSDIANNAVTTPKIKNNHVRAADIQRNAVSSGEIRNGQTGAGDFGPSESLHVLTPGELSTGGENDCIWSTTPTFPTPARLNPAGYYKDVLGYVHLTGVLFPSNGPGGDTTCGGPTAEEASEDSVAFVLPAGYRPTIDVVGGVGTLVIGSTPLVSPAGSWPAGAVANFASPGSPILLDGIVFEPTGLAGGLTRQGGSGRSSAATGARSADAGDLERFADLFR